MKWRARWYFIKPWKKLFSNLFSPWEKGVSLKCGNFCRSTPVFLKKSLQKSVLVQTNPYEWEQCSEVYFTWRGLPLTLLTFFYGYNAFGYICILFILKNKTISIHQLLYFGDMILNGISFDFCRKPRKVDFDLNSTFSLSYKISFADLRPLFMERIKFSKVVSYNN